MNSVYLGIDIGSTTVKVVVIDRQRNLLHQRYLRSNGQPRQTLLRAIADLQADLASKQILGVGLTGSGGDQIAQLIGGQHCNELIAQTRAVGEFHPEARTVIEIGGQDSKFLAVEWDARSEKMVLVDFAMNALCAAGTGSFLDQQAERLGISIEEEFANLALQSTNPARIAGRCTVFAKSDMIHLQQKGIPLADILAGLCLALARNFKGVIGKGKAFTPPILFQGGVAYNQGVVRAFERLLKLKPGQLIVPENHPMMAALGTAFVAMDEDALGKLSKFIGFEPLEAQIKTQKNLPTNMEPLKSHEIQPARCELTTISQAKKANSDLLSVYLGIDVGSISTNVVLLDEETNVIARRYLQTAGRPIEAVRQALHEIGLEVGEKVLVQGVGTTGSGRHLTADFVGGDVIRNEITAQARAAIALDPTVDTVFEIGGQDSKYISLKHGAVVNFAMNSACAAGTGSFLEEQADRLKIDIKSDFSDLALAAEHPTCLGERCTVFMESDIVHHQQQGAQVAELTAGLAYAIAQNYLNRVVNGRLVGKNVFFQGGVAWNQGVVAAFQQLLGRKITVPPHHDVTGAIGSAILAMEELTSQREQGQKCPTRFRGFDLSDRHYETTTFECKSCPNLCEISKIFIAKEAPIYYGARCDIFEDLGHNSPQHKKLVNTEVPDLFGERVKLLLGDYTPPDPRRNGKPRIGIPRSLIFYDLFPFWRTFFGQLGLEIVLSDATNPKITHQTVEHANAEACFPVKLAYGHVVDLLEKQVDFVFLPSVINRENIASGQSENNYCPFIPASSYMVAAQIDFRAHGVQPINFPLHMFWQKAYQKELKALGKQLEVPSKRLTQAISAAEAAQKDFYLAIRQRGREILHDLGPTQQAAVLVGRPYNTSDLGVCHDLPFKLRKRGILPIPMDFLPLETVNLSERYGKMFWRSGQDILAAATIIKDDPRLQAIYVTSFNCGPDSFISSFFTRILDDKPFLELEMDDHTADAGVITRCEAFFDSLKMGLHRKQPILGGVQC